MADTTATKPAAAAAATDVTNVVDVTVAGTAVDTTADTAVARSTSIPDKPTGAPEAAASGSLAANEPAVGKAQHFSDSQKEVIAKLRERLPDIIKGAQSELEKDIDAILWGVPLVSASGQQDLRVDVILNKFIKARGNDVEQAQEMLKNTLVWREKFNVAGILDEEFPEDVFANVGYIYGHDPEGRPVTYNTYGNLDNAKVFGDLDRFLRWRVQLHERGMRMLDFVDVADMVQVHDYDGVGLLSYDKTARAASKATVQLMSDNYPETLATKIFANVPGWGETIFNIVCRWLSEETKSKFVVVSKSSAARVLAERIGAENLPPNFVTSKPEAVAASGSSAPKPETAHVDPADNVPKPTNAGSDTDSVSSKSISSRSSVSSTSSQRPAAPAVTAAPEPLPAQDEDDLSKTTAGMRLDEKTDHLQTASETAAAASASDAGAGSKLA
ncbi:Non-classical phosphatidylinositol transfer protein (PITP) [Coemansia sp. RSA 1721]|nr:Non-classical phosphatidylinositol transfer protein (PITP) [Coemansia sp. RSA 1721]